MAFLSILLEFKKTFYVRLFFAVNYCNILATFRLKRPVFFLKAERGVLHMTIGDALLCLVDKLLEERERVVRLELSKQNQQTKDVQTDKDCL